MMAGAHDDHYAEWPYATGYLLRTLDPDLIEKHAEQILSRALNIGRVVGFIGAGAAMSYGRISWQALVQTEIERVTAQFEARKSLAGAQSWRGRKFRDVRRLKATLDRLSLPRASVQADRYPMLFQVSEQLDRALAAIDPDVRAPSMREHASRLTVDDSGHAFQILINALRYREASQPPPQVGDDDETRTEPQAKAFLDSKLKPDLPVGLESRVNDQRYLQFFRVRSLRRLAAELTVRGIASKDGPAGALLKIAHRIGGRGDAYLLPTERFLVGALLMLAPARPGEWIRSELSWWDKPCGSPAPNVETAVARQKLVTEWRDPLLILQERLQINRFLTTNYDREIERLFSDQGFRHRGDGDEDTASMMRPISEDRAFDSAQAGELASFAVRDRGRGGAVIHLHGRANRATAENPSTFENMVITELDYQKLYLRSDGNRDMVDNAIALAFGANPLLFVGSGMGEDDILRPLRHFMSGQARVGDRIAIALLPARESDEKQVEEKIALLGRYGVYAIHFGAASIDEPEGPVQAAWLPWFWRIRGSLRSILERMGENPLAHDGPSWAKSAAKAALNQHYADLVKTLDAGPRLKTNALGSDPAPSAVPSPAQAFREIVLPVAGRKARAQRAANNLRVALAAFRLRRPTKIEGQYALRAHRLDLQDELDIVNGCLAFVSREGAGKSTRPEDYRAARALLESLDGAADAVLAVFTCARLLRVWGDWQDWKEAWYSVPAPRIADLSQADLNEDRSTTNSQDFRVVDLLYPDARAIHRHAIDMPSKPEDDAAAGRFYAGAPSQAYFSLLTALYDPQAERFRKTTGRRILVLPARRGVGKGHLFSALEHSDLGTIGPQHRALDLLEALTAGLSPGAKPRWAALAFFNLSFSQEVMSVFDRITRFLIETLELLLKASSLHAEDLATLQADSASLRNSRIERLRMALQAWQDWGERSPDGRARVLVAINSIDVLFDREGEAKNGQVKKLFDLLTSAAFDKAPIDFVYACQIDHVPRSLRGGVKGAANPTPLVRPGLDAKSRASTREQLRGLGLDADENRAAVWRPDIAIHPLHPAPATIIIGAYFPRIALLIARGLLRGLDPKLIRPFEAWKDAPFPPIFEPTATEFRAAVQQAIEQLHPRTRPDGVAIMKRRMPLAIAFLTILLELRAVDNDGQLATQLKAFFSIPAGHPWTLDADLQAATKILHDHLETRPGRGTLDLGPVLQKLTAEFDDEMRRLFAAVNGGRFLMTVMLSGAYEATTVLSRKAFATVGEPHRARGCTFTEGVACADIDQVTDLVGAFLRRTRLALLGAPERRAADVVIEEVLSTQRRHAERGDLLPLRMTWEPKTTSPQEDATPAWLKPFLHRAMTEVIWHLSVIGQPAQATVLVHCPRIARLHKELLGRPDCPGILEFVHNAIQLAVHRCLVFRLRPELGLKAAAHAEEPDLVDRDAPMVARPDDGARYAVHRLVQRHVFQSLGSPDIEYPDADQFTLSLYGSQPEELPRLGLESHRQIKTVIETLSAYPGDWTLVEYPPDPHHQRWLLRAALGIMRTIYSVAVLARFDDRAHPARHDETEEGYFEEYRRLVRWVLMMSDRLARTSASDTSTGEDGPGGPPAPFYPEEIVWLFNECAVLSLVQGRLTDAQANFEIAAKAAHLIEPGPLDPLRLRIQLNSAVVDIERGQGADARRHLERIANLPGEHEVLQLLARGYMGLVDHMAGEADRATEHYTHAITKLVGLHRTRAASIFSRHYGDLLSNLGPGRREESWQRLSDAVHFAQEGGHEDVRYMALLSQLKFRLQHDDPRTFSAIHRELDGVARYATAVGMPRLQCEVNLASARLLLQQGETQRAAELATEALRTATVNDMRQRKISGLLLLAEINLSRGHVAVAKPLLAQGAKMAKAFGNHHALTKAQALELQLAATL